MVLSSVIHALLLLSCSHKQPLIKQPAWEWKPSTVNPSLCVPKQSSTKYRDSDMIMTLQGPNFPCLSSSFQCIISCRAKQQCGCSKCILTFDKTKLNECRIWLSALGNRRAEENESKRPKTTCVYVLLTKPEVIMALVRREQRRKSGDVITEPQSSGGDEVRIDGWVKKTQDLKTGNLFHHF